MVSSKIWGLPLLYVEKKIDTTEELARHMSALDEDEGIRTVGNSKSPVPNGYVFITKSNERYCINVCEKIWDTETASYKVGGNDKYFYFDTFEETWKMVTSIVELPLEAWLY
jgi:hypothetical protein